MPEVKTILRLDVDLSRPVDEIKGCIASIVNAHPASKKEILQQVEMWLGENLTNLEKQKEKVDTEKLDKGG